MEKIEKYWKRAKKQDSKLNKTQWKRGWYESVPMTKKNLNVGIGMKLVDESVPIKNLKRNKY